METSLQKVVRLSGVDLMEPSALGGPGGSAHAHLMQHCSFYSAVHHGQKADPKGCKATAGKGLAGVIYKMTPHTAEASTVPEPTVGPGGPGLFHHKGLQLPPYIQHLWHHLAPKYGKHEAYGMAVGIVKKWAAGVNPGGWKTKSGKGKRTHPDVRAAAQKNVAEWEQDRTEGGDKHG